MTQQLTLAPGDPVVYPKHGAGVVRGVTERTALGHTQPYYDIELRASGMQVLVPVGRARDLGLRRVTPEQDIPALLSALAAPDLDLPAGFPPRIRAEQAVLESADILEIARLVGTLARRHVLRGLADSEHQLMRQAKHAVTTEVAVSLELTDAEAGRLVDERLP